MPDERFEDHLLHPVGRGHVPAGSHAGAAGGAVCGDLVTISLAVAGETVVDAGFEASGCGAAIAAGSAAVELVRGAPLLDAARVGTEAIARALGGLSVGKLHAADLASDALHRALGAAAAADAQAAPVADRTLVAMSGGVDSAVAAVLSDGEVVAVTLELWRDPENDAEASCCSANAVRAARSVAHRLGLPHFTLDLRDTFRAGVVEPWMAEHAEGLTPNPCVRCNGHVRLDAMLDFADRLGAATLATGHYARRTGDGLLRAAADPAKDQTYMLAALSRATLRRMRFPLGELTKPRVRELAREHALSVAEKPDSQDLCFLAGTGRERFLARHGGMGERPGDVVDRSGQVLGRHRGHFHFTVGQRRGLGVHATEPLYVLGTDARANTVTVGPRAALDVDRVALRGVRLHRDAGAVDGVRLRYHAAVLPCRLEEDAVVLSQPFSAPAPGQTAVLLAGDVVVGSATIRS
ncbi:MAG TPA: tRNA 2-thiouridine(34) synthase MnmA [Baekduia sp.]|uniref:tRNA 2-thiouridine(34) synthase MnmA n=1 Tax=Baekduia sp. TaxID=2600305 RepID=UPI002B5404A2|nr:tRNA 2-thiouridine(34) synthase MnmA [Baekduia sp.]HMJ33031.1 tRNA 2-thiouridine(34) synthase MnmA [Baekduia sp.]